MTDSTRFRTIRDCWDGYRRQVLSPTASTSEIQTAYFAFFGGAAITIEMLVAAGRLPEPQASEEIDRLDREIKAFVQAGKDMIDARRN